MKKLMDSIMTKMTDEEGLFQGGRKGRLFGRARDAVENMQYKTDVNILEDLKQNPDKFYGHYENMPYNTKEEQYAKEYLWDDMRKYLGEDFDLYRETYYDPKALQSSKDMHGSSFARDEGFNLGNMVTRALNAESSQVEWDGTNYVPVEGKDPINIKDIVSVVSKIGDLDISKYDDSLQSGFDYARSWGQVGNEKDFKKFDKRAERYIRQREDLEEIYE